MRKFLVQQGQHMFKFNEQSIKVSIIDQVKIRGKFLKSMFLPKNYPHSVTGDYFKFTAFQFVQSATGTIAGTISTQAMLHALGLGAGISMGLAATTNWIIKDGFGLLGGVLYAGLMGSRFDASPKRYRFWAAISIQGATLIEILTPFFPSYFVLMASVANVGKNIGWLASAATRAAMHKGFTKADNLGDVTAKSGAQGTAAGLVGTGLGIGISWFLGSSGQTIDPLVLFTIFAPLSLVNISAAYFGNFSVITRTLNEERLQLAIKPLIDSIILSGNRMDVLSPDIVSEKESLFLQRKDKNNVILGPSLIDLISSSNEFLIESLISDNFASKYYRIYVSPENSVCIWFLDGCNDSQKLQGYFHASTIRHLIYNGMDVKVVYMKSLEIISGIDISQLLQSKGWEINNLHLGGKADLMLKIKDE